MSKALCSVGLDVGTTTTQLIVSRLEIENRASGFAVPELSIARREVIYQSPVHFTPLAGAERVDGDGIRRIVEAEYRKAGLCREDVDTGAVIITGETSRKENARAVLDALSEFAGDFVVATAGPDLESVLAAKGAGATAYSARTGKRVLHMDIGGGTANLALIEDGAVTATGCLNVGGRLLKFDSAGKLLYISPVLEKLCKLNAGDCVTEKQAAQVAQMLTEGLEMAAGLREPTELLNALWTKESASDRHTFSGASVISFSGGVADCIEKALPWLSYGDIGPLLGQAIRKSHLCRGEYRLGEQTIRATVIGAGSHSAQLSGSTVFCRTPALPLKNVPVAVISQKEQALPHLAQTIRQKLSTLDVPGILALPGYASPSYTQIAALAEAVAEGLMDQPVMVAVEQDMAKALGQAIALRLPPDTPVLCIDRVRLESGSFLDVGLPVGPALPVVVKTLVLAQ